MRFTIFEPRAVPARPPSRSGQGPPQGPAHLKRRPSNANHGQCPGKALTEPLSKTNALYFTVTDFATVGFGDITPKTEAARVATMVQMIADLVAVGLVARVIVGAVKAGQQQRSTDTGAGDASAEAGSGDSIS